MTRRGLASTALALLAACPAAALAAPAAHATPPDIGLAIDGTVGAAGWYVSDVVLRWTVGGAGILETSGCEPALRLSADTPRAERTCRATNPDGTATRTAVVKIDRTPPAEVTAAPARPPAATGWFTAPVDVVWRGADATSGVAACTTLTHAGPESPAATLAGTCRDNAGNASGPVAATVAYDASPPTLTGPPVASRPPDRNGWYTAPVTLTWAATDGGSGVARCTTLTYAGPDAEGAAPTGTCTDHAGNVTPPVPAQLRYDATPPAIGALEALTLRRGRVRLSWAVAGATTTTLVRRPGRRGARAATLKTGPGHATVDRGLRAGRRYTYELRALDPAGNTATRRVRVVGGAATTARLLTPRHGATLRRPPLLRWRPVARASYYNVQLFRGRAKLRSVWTTAPRLQLRRRLRPGLYRWYVWPGYGKRAERRYGRLALRAAFRIA